MNNKPEPADIITAYRQHGVDLDPLSDAKEVYASECVFCGKSKFSINTDTSKFHCKSCEAYGNLTSFLERIHIESLESTSVDDYKELAANRNFLYPDSLVQWQLAKSITTGDWLFPGYNLNSGKVNQLYQYKEVQDGDKKRRAWIPTKTVGHKLMGLNMWDQSKDVVYLLEGCWDAIAFWEVARGYKVKENLKLVQTGSYSASIAGKSNIVATPGAMIFLDRWAPIFVGKQVYLIGQNDHERKNKKTGKTVKPASLSGMERITKILTREGQPPDETFIAWWGENGWDKDLPSGYDVRDLLTKP